MPITRPPANYEKQLKEYRDISLKEYNSFGMDVRAARMIEFESADELAGIFSESLAGEWYVLGGGNNILFTRDYNGTMLHPVGRGIEITGTMGNTADVRAEAGVEWDDFVAWCVGRGLWGAENLSRIPGYVGAAPIQNIGAYGVEAGDIICNVEAFCTDSRSMVTIAGRQCGFGYRDSVFKQMLRGRVIITAVNFRLSVAAHPKLGYGDLRARVEEFGGASIENIRKAVIAIREGKLPDPKITGNAGSFFKNPVVNCEKAAELRGDYSDMPLYDAPSGVKLAAGWLIEQCGWNGVVCGNAGVHDRQALVLINRGGAAGSEIAALAETIRVSVAEKFGVELEPEVNIL